MNTHYGQPGDCKIVTADVEYSPLFDERVEEMLETLSEHYSRPQLNAVKRTLVQLMCKSHNTTIQFIEKVIDYASQNGSRVVHEPSNALAVKYVLHIMAQKLKELLKLKPLTDENYHKRLREDIENFANEAAVNAMAANVNDGRKNDSFVNSHIDIQKSRFQRLEGIAEETTELKKTITAFYKLFDLDRANIFFDICRDLIETCRGDIESKLGKPIPVHSYISTICMMLEHKDKFHIPEIKKEFENIYAPITGRKKIVNCMMCLGQNCLK